jgi:hypothetical protein
LIGRHQLNILFIPAGAGFNGHTVEATGNRVSSMKTIESVTYRVRLCMWPALFVGSGKEMHEDLGSIADYRLALLDARGFFPDEPGKFKDGADRKMRLIAKEQLLVERVEVGAGKDE